MSGPDLIDDALLDDILGGLGTPPVAVPRADAAAILGRAALVGAPVAAAGALVGWKLWGMGLLIATLGFGGGFAARGLQATPADTVIVQAPGQVAPPAVASAPVAGSVTAASVAGTVTAAPVVASGTPPVAPSGSPVSLGAHVPAGPVLAAAPPSFVMASPIPIPDCPEPELDDGLADDSGFFDEPEPSDDDLVPVATWPADPGDPQEDAEAVAVPAPEEPIEAAAVAPAPVRRNAPRVVVIAGLGGFGGFGSFGFRAPLVGPGINGRLALIRSGDAVVQPMVRFGGEVVLLSGNDEQESRFVGGLHVDGGFVLGRKKVRLDVSWAGAIRVMPPASDIDGADDEEAGWIFAGTGPELGLTVGRPGRGAFRVGALAHGAILDLDGDGVVALVPWFGITLGAELPVGPR